MVKLGVWLKEKGMEVEKMAAKDINHKDKFEMIVILKKC